VKKYYVESNTKGIFYKNKEKRKGNWIGKIFIDGKIEGRIEVLGRRGRRCKQLLDDLK
jgi:hypothetical protein